MPPTKIAIKTASNMPPAGIDDSSGIEVVEIGIASA
jgi:hypothetical protein